MRIRYENWRNSTIKGYKPGDHDEILLERVRLDLQYHISPTTRIFLQLQDAHAFLTRFTDADYPQSSPIEDAIDIRQLFCEWRRLGGSPIGFRLGRQQISYADQRVFGPGSWGNTGRYAWNAAVLLLETPWFESEVWVGSYLRYKSSMWPNRAVDSFLTIVQYGTLNVLPFRADVFYVYRRDRSEARTGVSDGIVSHSIGTYTEGKPLRGMDAAITLIGQFGRHGSEDIRAWGAAVSAGYTFPSRLQPRIGVEYTIGSGDGDRSDGVFRTFDGVYGGRDIYFYGYTSLFFWANLKDAKIDFRLRPHHSISYFLEYHHFALTDPHDAWYTTGLGIARCDASGTSGTSLGDELDTRIEWNPCAHVHLVAGFGVFSPGSFVRRTGPSEKAVWSFIQSTFLW